MRIKKGGWSHRVYLWFEKEEAKENPTICEFIGETYIQGFFFLLLAVPFMVLLSPFFLIESVVKKIDSTAWSKARKARQEAIQAAKKSHPSCPFGFVKFVDAKENHENHP